MEPRLVFLRDDDVWSADRVFCALFDLCRRRDIPMVYGVVPQRVTPSLTSFVRRGPGGRFRRFDLVQHGWAHRNYGQGPGDKYEFGPARSSIRQQQDIARGMARMQALFGKRFFPAFVPPFHGYDGSTLAAVRLCGFRVFSAGTQALPAGDTVLDLPAPVALNDYASDGTPVTLETRVMVSRLTASLARRPVTGLLFHHRVLRARGPRQAMERFLGVLARLRDKGEVRLVRFSDLAR